jgi:hypothetical protein
MRRISFLKMVWLMGFVGALTVFTAITTNANPETRLLKRSVSKDVVTKFDHFEVTVPADAADQEMTVEEAELDLNGISVPYSFKPVSKMFRFGPHGMKFLKGKELRFNYFLAKGEEAAKLYYINRDKKCLERVQDQQYMSKTRKLEARLRHFSDYVAGVESGWDGNGINPFFDYVHHGEEVVQINANRDIKIRSKVLTLKGYGYMDFNLAFERGGEDTNYLNPLKVRGRGHWDIPFMMYSPYEIYVYIPERGGFIINGSTGGLVRHERFGLSETYYYNLNGVSFKVGRKEFNSDEGVVYEPWVVLSDGTCIERFRISPQSAMRITDPKGNQIHYIFERYQTSSDSDYEYHISSITDSVGRQIKFNYSGLYNPDYTGVTLISNGVSKTILNGFTDVLGRTTTYDWDGNNLMITYTNGVRSEYIREWKGFDNDLLKPVVVVTEHRMYKPGSSTPFIKSSGKMSIGNWKKFFEKSIV